MAFVELGAAKVNKEEGEVRDLKEQIACLKAALAKKEGESEEILSTQSSPSVNTIRKGNATPALPKNRQPMEEVGNLEVQSIFTPTQKRSKLHLSGILTENNSSDSIENCNGLLKKVGLGVCANKMAGCDNHFENSNSFIEAEHDTTQLPTSFYQRYSPLQQSSGTESVRSEGSHNYGPAATSCSDQVVVPTIGLKATGISNIGASTIKKPELTPPRSINPSCKSPLSQRKLQTPIRNRNHLGLSSTGGRRTPNDKVNKVIS